MLILQYSKDLRIDYKVIPLKFGKKFVDNLDLNYLNAIHVSKNGINKKNPPHFTLIISPFNLIMEVISFLI
jgi:hypothetical protein